jgi:hypothetical protein
MTQDWGNDIVIGSPSHYNALHQLPFPTYDITCLLPHSLCLKLSVLYSGRTSSVQGYFDISKTL